MIYSHRLADWTLGKSGGIICPKRPWLVLESASVLANSSCQLIKGLTMLIYTQLGQLNWMSCFCLHMNQVKLSYLRSSCGHVHPQSVETSGGSASCLAMVVLQSTNWQVLQKCSRLTVRRKWNDTSEKASISLIPLDSRTLRCIKSNPLQQAPAPRFWVLPNIWDCPCCPPLTVRKKNMALLNHLKLQFCQIILKPVKRNIGTQKEAPPACIKFT